MKDLLPHRGDKLQADIRHIYTVSELTSDIKAILENKYPFLWISGEISNYRKAGSGHAYFTLKDPSAQISAVIFRGQQRNIDFTPEDGMQVCGFGRISVYEPRGTYQVILEYLEPRGVGALLLAFEKLKEKLRDEGLFDEAHKKNLPLLPGKVSIITSPSGAAVRDFLKVAHRRFPNAQILILPVRVQGTGADTEVCQAIRTVNERADSDLIVLARGGGSVEDLSVFNSEHLARTIFDSQIPIVSAIGHETDYTISDFVADMRAPTPSAAAEMVFPEKRELMSAVERLAEQLSERILNMIDRNRLKVSEISKRLVHPRKKLQDLQMRNDDYAFRLQSAMKRLVLSCSQQRSAWTDRLALFRPRGEMDRIKEKLENNRQNLLKNIIKNINNNRMNLRRLSTNLHALSPNAVLRRGYSITKRMRDGHIVREASEVNEMESVEILLAHGKLVADVRKTLIET